MADWVSMCRRAVWVVVVVVVLLVASACSSGPTEADIARGEVIVADPVFGVVIDRPVAVGATVIHGDDPISESDTIEVWKAWRSDGTAEHGVVAQLVDVAVSSGWVALKAECNDRGAVRVTGPRCSTTAPTSKPPSSSVDHPASVPTGRSRR